ncbi:MAG TPA: carbon-nitrogen hydrolase family protein [Beijerinckiaceae bacterium]|nr:carbon-nitrogen hydrolase family protein [Beijerinckiaceae bacterium]
MKVALIQTNPGDDKAANLAEAERLIEQAVAQERPDFVMLPEVFDWMGSPGRDKLQACEPERDGPAYRMCQSQARKHGIWVHSGSFRTISPGQDRFANTSVVFDRSGREAARYAKIHMFDITAPNGQSYRESAGCQPGDRIVTFDCDGVRVGLAICYDLRFPELFQALVQQGAEIIALPAAFTLVTGMDHWEVLCRARAIETECFVLACGQTGAYQYGTEKRANFGRSMIVDPWGDVIAKAAQGVGYVAGKLNLSRIAEVRRAIPVAEHKVIGRRIKV